MQKLLRYIALAALCFQYSFITSAAVMSDVHEGKYISPGVTGTGDSTDVSSLPLHVYQPEKSDDSKPAIVIISGDGGWNNFIDGLARTYAEKGFHVAGIDALKYFWHKSNPKAAAGDVAKVIDFYTGKWHKKKVLLVGYSFGADVLPFIYDDFPEKVKSMIPLLVFMSPSHHASFEFQLTGWLKDDTNSPYLVVPEIKKITRPQIIVIYGKRESENLTGDLPESNVRFVAVEGGHHFNDDYQALTNPVIRQLPFLSK